MSEQTDFRLPAGFRNVPKSSTVDYFQRQWESCKSKRESDKGDEAKMSNDGVICPCRTTPGSIEDGRCLDCGLELFKTKFEMREFSGGATRSSQDGKPEFAGFLSPIVIRRFGEYMLVHQKQEDGKLRKSDNWKKGMTRRVYVESMFRHFVDVWEEITGDTDKPALVPVVPWSEVD